MLRIGIISTVDQLKRTVRVTYPDKDNLVSGELPVIGPTTLNLPIVGDCVLVGYPSNGSNGFCLGVIPDGGGS